MRLSDLDPDFRARVRLVPPLPFGWRRALPALRVALRLALRTRVVDGVEVRDVAMGPARVRVYRGPGPASGAGLLWMHGGGLIVGDEGMDDRQCSAWARDLGLVVVSVGYRLAPEHPFPAGHDDCFAAWRWFVEQAPRWGVDPSRIAVAGGSAGGCHAAALAQRVRDAGGPQPAGQLLVAPMLDDRTAADRGLDAGYFLWRWTDNHAGWRAYLGAEPGAPSTPRYAVPARMADLSGLPPAWIGCGDRDLFHAESLRYAERLRAAGVEVTVVEVPRAPHGFHGVAPEAPASVAFVADHDRWLRARLGIER